MSKAVLIYYKIVVELNKILFDVTMIFFFLTFILFRYDKNFSGVSQVIFDIILRNYVIQFSNLVYHFITDNNYFIRNCD